MVFIRIRKIVHVHEDFKFYKEKKRTGKRKYRKKRNLIVDGLNSIRGISCDKPKGSFYVFPNVKKIGKNSETVANELLEKANVVTIPGSAFGPHGEGYLRISYANSEENLREAVKRIKKYIENLA